VEGLPACLASSGKRRLGVFKFLMTSNAATPKLLKAACQGEALTETTITVRKAGKDQQEYMVWKLKDGLIASVDTGFIDSGSTIPHDEVSNAFRKIEMTYKQQNADGTLGGGVMFSDNYDIN
jgi:type VI secretion system secreted protein Hcp